MVKLVSHVNMTANQLSYAVTYKTKLGEKGRVAVIIVWVHLYMAAEINRRVVHENVQAYAYFYYRSKHRLGINNYDNKYDNK